MFLCRFLRSDLSLCNTLSRRHPVLGGVLSACIWPNLEESTVLLPHPVIELAPIYASSQFMSPLSRQGWNIRRATVLVSTSSWFQSPIVQPISIRLIGSVMGSRCRNHWPVRASSILVICAWVILAEPIHETYATVSPSSMGLARENKKKNIQGASSWRTPVRGSSRQSNENGRPMFPNTH